MPMTPRRRRSSAFMGRSWKNVIASADERGGLPEGFRRRYLDGDVRGLRARSCEPVPGIAAALDAITLPDCVASSGVAREDALHARPHRALGRFEGRIFSATEVEHGKPAPDLFLARGAVRSHGLGRGRPTCAGGRGLDRPASRRAHRRRRTDRCSATRATTPRRARSTAPDVFTDMARAAGAASARVDPRERLGDAHRLLAALVLERSSIVICAPPGMSRRSRASRASARLPPTGSGAGKRTLLSP